MFWALHAVVGWCERRGEDVGSHHGVLLQMRGRVHQVGGPDGPGGSGGRATLLLHRGPLPLPSTATINDSAPRIYHIELLVAHLRTRVLPHALSSTFAQETNWLFGSHS
jgi:hypothetical protein